MIKDAESHAEDDRRQRELAEARNVAENAAYTAEKQVGEMDEQLDDAAKTEINDAIKAVREAIESDDVEQIKSRTEALQSAFHRVSEQIYAAAAEQQAEAGGDGASAASNGAGDEAEDEVVDAEVVDDDRA
jgi:molecular chaperone DnaK